MSFVSDLQRRWWFANHVGSSGVGVNFSNRDISNRSPLDTGSNLKAETVAEKELREWSEDNAARNDDADAAQEWQYGDFGDGTPMTRQEWESMQAIEHWEKHVRG